MKQPKVVFYLESNKSKNPNRSKEETVMARISFGYSKVLPNGEIRNEPCRVSLQGKILPAHFGHAPRYLFDSEVFRRYSKTNRSIRTRMDNLQRAVDRLEIKYLSENKNPTKEEFGGELMRLLNRHENESVHNIISFLKMDIKRYENAAGRDIYRKIEENTVKTYRTLLTILEEYEIATQEVLVFESLTSELYWNIWVVADEILRGVREVVNPNRSKKQVKNEYGYSVNSIRKYQDAFIKTIKRAQKDLSIETPLDVTEDGLKVPGAVPGSNVYVNEKELQKIYETDLSYDSSLEIAKEYVLVSSLTGMRYQSMADLSNQAIERCTEDGYNFDYVRSRQMKTKTEVNMPLMQPVREIVDKYEGKFPNWGANATMNKKLKKLFQELGMDEMVEEVIVTFHYKEVKLKKPKFQMITTHAGRRSFVTNLEIHRANRDVVDQMTHPDSVPKNAMRKHYDKRDLITKAKAFVDEVQKLDSTLYRL